VGLPPGGCREETAISRSVVYLDRGLEHPVAIPYMGMDVGVGKKPLRRKGMMRRKGLAGGDLSVKWWRRTFSKGK